MLINPGYASSGKESQVPYADKKIRDLRSMIDEKELATKIEIDGRISKENIRQYGFGTVDLFVGGTTCISRANIPGTVGELMKLRQQLIR
jgi:ribulose-phosphate 3-epimerase